MPLIRSSLEHQLLTATQVIFYGTLAGFLTSCLEGGLVKPNESAFLLGDTTSSNTDSPSSPAVELNAIEPNTGSALGGTQVRILGKNFRQSTVVLIDGKPCATSGYINSREFACMTRAHTGGTVDVEVRNLRTVLDGPNGIIQAELKSAFTYIDAQAPAVMSAGIGGGRSKNSGGSIILDAKIGEIGAAAIGNTHGESSGPGVVLRAGSVNAGASQ